MAHFQSLAFPFSVFSQQYFQHLLPDFLVVTPSSKEAQDPIRHQEDVLQHASEPRQKPEHIQQRCHAVRQVVQCGCGIVENAVS